MGFVDEDLDDGKKLKNKHRNQSFLIPRENSFS
jgi:hypothetical protein